VRRYAVGLAAGIVVAFFVLFPAGSALAATWNVVPGGSVNYLAVDLVDADHGWVAGSTYTPEGQVGIEPTGIIGRTSSGGASWLYSSANKVDGGSFGWSFLTVRTLDFVDVQRGWAALSDGTILASVDGGDVWTVQAEGSREFRDNNWSYNCISMADATHGAAVGDWVGFTGVTYPRIIYTTNGTDWKLADLPKPANTSLESVCMVDAQFGLAVGSAGPGDGIPLVLVTRDGGATWTQQTHGMFATGRDLHSVSFADRQHGWAVGDSGLVYVTVDGGSTWWRQTSGVAAALRAVRFVSPTTGWVVGDKGTVLATTTGGREWVPDVLPGAYVEANLRALASADRRVWVVGDHGVILAAMGPASGSGSEVFSDVADSPYRTAVESLAAAGFVSGFPDGTFRPDALVLRQQFAKMVVGALGIMPAESTDSRFTDLGVPDVNGYPHRFVQAAFDHGITKGVNDAQTLFAPLEPIRRDQVASMIVRGAASVLPGVLVDPPAGTSSLFADVGEPHGENLRIAEYNGLLAGLQGLGPSWDQSAFAARGEVAQMLYNLRLR
jgi:photosystem II stability/assembly factor-like uncharacterized protein